MQPLQPVVEIATGDIVGPLILHPRLSCLWTCADHQSSCVFSWWKDRGRLLVFDDVCHLFFKSIFDCYRRPQQNAASERCRCSAEASPRRLSALRRDASTGLVSVNLHPALRVSVYIPSGQTRSWRDHPTSWTSHGEKCRDIFSGLAWMVLLCSLNFQRLLGQLETAAPAHFCPCAAFEVEMFRRFDVRIVPPNPGSRAEKVESFIWVLAVFFPACRQKNNNKDA